jgi:hypothetical protein
MQERIANAEEFSLKKSHQSRLRSKLLLALSIPTTLFSLTLKAPALVGPVALRS